MEYRLEDICIKVTDGSHFSPKDDISSDIPMLSVKDMKEFNFDYSSCKHISLEDYQKMIRQDCVPKKDDVLVAKDGSYLKEIFVNEEDSEKALLSSIAIFRPNKEIVDPYFLCYLLKTPYIMNYTKENCVSGSALPRIILKAFKDIKLEIPDMKVQKKIVKIIKNLNEKIILNNAINDNLLKLCKYKYDELNSSSDNWSLTKINDLNLEVTDYVANGSFKSLADNVTLYDEKEYALYVRNTDLKVNFTDKRKYVDKKSYEFLKKSKLNGGELIISNVGDVGSVFICPHLDMPMTLGSNVVMIYSTDEHYYNFFLYFFFTSIYGQYMINGITGGSAQSKFNKTDFRNIEIKFPTLDELDRFNKYIKPIYNKYELNIKENERLGNFRDTLLPKLMNGEIDLDKIEI